jgi:competence protein ComEA
VDLVAAARDLNLAETLADGRKVLVPALRSPTHVGQGAPADVGGAEAPGRLDLNRATAAELETLPGIGPVTAARIVEARATQPFVSVDDLEARGLVGRSVYARIRDLVSVSP